MATFNGMIKEDGGADKSSSSSFVFYSLFHTTVWILSAFARDVFHPKIFQIMQYNSNTQLIFLYQGLINIDQFKKVKVNFRVNKSDSLNLFL